MKQLSTTSLRGKRHCEARSKKQTLRRTGLGSRLRRKTSLRGTKQEADPTKNRFGFEIASCLAMTQSVRSKCNNETKRHCEVVRHCEARSKTSLRGKRHCEARSKKQTLRRTGLGSRLRRKTSLRGTKQEADPTKNRFGFEIASQNVIARHEAKSRNDAKHTKQM